MKKQVAGNIYFFDLTIQVEDEAYSFPFDVVFDFEVIIEEVDGEIDVVNPDDEQHDTSNEVVEFELNAIVEAYIPDWEEPP